MMEFLYFPQDKTEYLPSILMLMIFLIAAVFFTRFLMKLSRREQQKVDEQYADKMIFNDKQNDH
ncbi:preprotein translocase subunit YajC [Salirhabdus euzebyi]|uniref:Preprotein translocase subunit YajC n=1 Tax=Salirhabdus euzebyi TaxID=394506 RepID=A0A841Q4V1_9BACI|nr:hypothetical protein [Salirhabdus euzebyi]MBB6453418.1 preprotein translocase subunit YajC [Salirhabdus euzebyi]